MSWHPEATRINWLVHRLLWDAIGSTLQRYATGVLVDIGCGVKPYAALSQGLVTRHIGVEHVATSHDHTLVDLFASAYSTALADGSVDTVLSTFVLEHLDKPDHAMREIARVLKVDGHAIVAVPLFWHLHEEPHDFYRYTAYGLKHLLEGAGLEVVELRPLSGFIVTFLQESCYYLAESPSRWLRALSRPLSPLLQRIAYAVHRHGWDCDVRFTWAYLAVARKSL